MVVVDYVSIRPGVLWFVTFDDIGAGLDLSVSSADCLGVFR